MKTKTIVAWTVKAVVMIAAPGGFFLAGYEAWKWWKHRHDQQKPQPLENKAEEAKEAKVPRSPEEVSEEKVN